MKSYSVSFVYPGGGPAIVLCIELQPGGVRCLNPVVKSYSVSFVYPGGGPAIVLCIELQPGAGV